MRVKKRFEWYLKATLGGITTASDVFVCEDKGPLSTYQTHSEEARKATVFVFLLRRLVQFYGVYPILYFWQELFTLRQMLTNSDKGIGGLAKYWHRGEVMKGLKTDITLVKHCQNIGIISADITDDQPQTLTCWRGAHLRLVCFTGWAEWVFITKLLGWVWVSLYLFGSLSISN